jgi:transposase
MAKPLSMDLRERVVAAVLQKGMSARRAAAHFGVSESSAIKWVRRSRTWQLPTGSGWRGGNHDESERRRSGP